MRDELETSGDFEARDSLCVAATICGSLKYGSIIETLILAQKRVHNV
jgi:hypothetical protein